MNFVQRAMINLRRNENKSVILFLIVLALGIVMSAAISSQVAIQNVDLNLQQKLPPIVTIDFDDAGFDACVASTGRNPEVEFLTSDILSAVGALSYVRDYNYSVTTVLLAPELELYPSGEVRFAPTLAGWSDFNLIGVHSSGMLDIEEGIIELTVGRPFTNEELSSSTYAAIISEELAALNGLHIGSKFTLDNIIFDSRNVGEWFSDFETEENIFAKQTYEFEVIGIFNSLVVFNTGNERTDASLSESLKNRIYVPNLVALEAHTYQMEQALYLQPNNQLLWENHADLAELRNTFILNDSRDIESFEAAATLLIPDFWTIVSVSDSFDEIIAAMDFIDHLTAVALWVVCGATVLIVTLLTILSLRERKQEIGIYLALGEKKGRLILQILTEVMVVALVAIAASLVVGNVFAGGISEMMLRNNIEAGLSSGDVAFSGLDRMGFSSLYYASTEEVLAAYSVSLDATTIALFFVAAIGTVLVATVIPMLYIVRFNPKKIML